MNLKWWLADFGNSFVCFFWYSSHPMSCCRTAMLRKPRWPDVAPEFSSAWLSVKSTMGYARRGVVPQHTAITSGGVSLAGWVFRTPSASRSWKPRTPDWRNCYRNVLTLYVLTLSIEFVAQCQAVVKKHRYLYRHVLQNCRSFLVFSVLCWLFLARRILCDFHCWCGIRRFFAS